MYVESGFMPECHISNNIPLVLEFIILFSAQNIFPPFFNLEQLFDFFVIPHNGHLKIGY